MTPEGPRPEPSDRPPAWRLPRGRHRLPREVVEAHQRSRLIAGIAAAATEHGFARLSVEQIIAAAGVSRTTFYTHFENKYDAVDAAYGEVFQHLLVLIVQACNGESEWPLKVRAAIAAVLEFAAAEPAKARLLTLDTLAFDHALARRVLDNADHFAGLLRGGRERYPEAGRLPTLTEKACIGAISGLITNRLMAGKAKSLPDLLPELVELTLLPYLGATEAAKVAAVETDGAA